MAKKKQHRQAPVSNGLIKACAFVGIVISALLFLIGAILNWCKMGNVTNILHFIAQLTLLVAVAFPAWDYVKYKNRTWRIIYMVSLFVYIFGVVFGFIRIYI
jgi:hypothetical protein